MNLIGYEGLIDNGQVRLKGAPRLPDGTRLLVVVTEYPVWVSRGMTAEEWREPFEEFAAGAQAAAPAPLEDQPLSDEEINVDVRAVRREQRAARRD